MDRLFGDLGFKIHFATYVAVNLLLVIINLLTTPHLLWFYWPLIGWGIGLIAHGATIYYTSNRRVTRERVVREKLASRG
jgi:2TM domain